MTNFETMIMRETVCARRLLGATTETSVNGIVFKEMINHYSADVLYLYLNLYSLVNVATVLWAGRFGVWFPVGSMDLSLLQRKVHTSSGAHSVFYSMGTGGSFCGGKTVWYEADSSPPYVSTYFFIYCFHIH